MSSLTPQNCKEDGDVKVRGGDRQTVRQTDSQRNRERRWIESEREAEKRHRERERDKHREREG